MSNILILLIALTSAFCIMTSCAVTHPVSSTEYSENSNQKTSYPQYSGKKIPVAVVPLGLSKRTSERYPHLLKKLVGFGIHNMIIQELYDSNRFQLVEDNPTVIKEVLERLELGESGLLNSAEAAELGKFIGARKVVYGEVYDYAQGIDGSVVLLKDVSQDCVRVGIQLNIVDVETLEVIPSSGTAYGLDWGKAARKSVHKAVYSLIQER
ncbi:MAG: CsgG/HfaB family protein [Desulfovermiculus sp.]|nr:CsgG/HfaB family protein [Desulfovermiculus sp.]